MPMARCQAAFVEGERVGITGAAEQDQLGGERTDAGQLLQASQGLVPGPVAQPCGVELIRGGGVTQSARSASPPRADQHACLPERVVQGRGVVGVQPQRDS